ncbi:MAG: hypothetical protein J5367_04745 [Lachnospiraceae bacterium]|nr:hypothetical protein [Lachnospiraceae bacterium]
MKKMIITILIAFIVCLAAVGFKNYCSCMIPIHNRGIEGLLSQGDQEILFLGSSTFRSNLDIDMLDENFDDSAYILAYGGNQYIACSIQYDEIKRRGGHTDILVIELDPLLLTEEVKLSDSRVIWDLSWEGKKRLWQRMSESSDADLPLFFEYFVTAGMDDLITYPVTEPFYATRYKKGAKTGETPSGGAQFLENEQFDISTLKPVKAQEEALLSLIRKCRADNVPYILLECPHYHRLQEDPVYQENLTYITELVKNEDAQCIFAADTGFDTHNPEYFEDMSHMSAEGRRVYTKALIDRIRSTKAY